MFDVSESQYLPLFPLLLAIDRLLFLLESFNVYVFHVCLHILVLFQYV